MPPDHQRPTPRATYRLQLTKDFTFQQAGDLAPYLAKLGISHAYLSPILKARKGSTHGYDTVDHSMLHPELGTRLEFEQMARKFQAHGVRIILDIVPNHMGVGGDENALWLDVLEHGRESRYAEWFDINWTPSEPSLHNKVLVPFLGTSFGEALQQGKLELRYDGECQKFAVWAEGCHKLPISPDTYPLIGGVSNIAQLNSASGRAALTALIEAQHWRPARYSVAADDLNYRRFFIVSDLAAIRIEREDVFDHVHKLVFDLIEQGFVDGLRVDHIDGLLDPKAYCLALRQKSPRPIYLVVEKILAPHESLRSDWDVEGTTGYEFSGAATRLLSDPAGEDKLTTAYQGFTGRAEAFNVIEREGKRSIIQYEMAGELEALAVRYRAIAASSPLTADLTRNGLRNALREVVAAMPVYRTYVDSAGADQDDKRNIALAVSLAKEAAPTLDPALFNFISNIMAGVVPEGVPPGFGADVLEAARRTQQYTGPVMAKGLEDTALYRYNRLIALSDVGEKPDRFSQSIAAFHDFNIYRQKHLPHSMLTSSSHDTKRGEDTRARIAVLSGYADEWSASTDRWRDLLQADAADIDANDLYHFFQLLLGAWPTSFPAVGAIDPAPLETLRERLEGVMLKSIREARVRTSWNVPKQEYEERVAALVRAAFSQNSAFMNSFRAFEGQIGAAGAQNGLIETVLKLTVPGVPDIYQGAELWEQSMVDPDNRRAVDFDIRSKLLVKTEAIHFGVLADRWRDGAVKQALISRLLGFRRVHPQLFAEGTYEPVENAALEAAGICAFKRRYHEELLLVMVQLYPWRESTIDVGTLALIQDVDAKLSDILRDDSDYSLDHPVRIPFAVFANGSQSETKNINERSNVSSRVSGTGPNVSPSPALRPTPITTRL